MSYVLIQTDSMGNDPQIVATSSSQNGNLASFGNFCSANNIFIVNWSVRSAPGQASGYGMYTASQLSDQTNYNLFQIVGLADWQGDPTQNYFVNDIGMLRWLSVPSVNMIQEHKDGDDW